MVFQYFLRLDSHLKFSSKNSFCPWKISLIISSSAKSLPLINVHEIVNHWFISNRVILVCIPFALLAYLGFLANWNWRDWSFICKLPSERARRFKLHGSVISLWPYLSDGNLPPSALPYSLINTKYNNQSRKFQSSNCS